MYDCKNYRKIENDEKTHTAMANFAPSAGLLWDTSPVTDRNQRSDFDARSANRNCFANRDRLANGNACPDANDPANGCHLSNPKR